MTIRQYREASRIVSWVLASWLLGSGTTFAQSVGSNPPLGKTGLAFSFQSIGDKPAILFDSPSVQGQRNYILPRWQPVEILVKLDKWVKVRDADNTVGWIESALVSDRRQVQVSVPVADVRSMPAASAALVFEAQRNVILELAGPVNDGWVAVRHRDGQSGYVRSAQVWGE